MAFANPLVITLGGSGGTAKNLPKINQDAYGSEYYLRGTGEEFRVKIRHSKERPLADGRVLDRHNVTVTHTVFATSTEPEYLREVSLTLRNMRPDDPADVSDLGEALSYLMGQSAYLDLIGWVN